MKITKIVEKARVIINKEENFSFSSGTPCSKEDVKTLERKINFDFPDSLIELFINYGAKLNFFGICFLSIEDIEPISYEFDDIIRLIPFAKNGAGEYYAFSELIDGSIKIVIFNNWTLERAIRIGKKIRTYSEKVMEKKASELFNAFRHSLHSSLRYWSYASFELIESLASFGHMSKKVTALSLSPCFQRQYPAITKVIHHFDSGKRFKTQGHRFKEWEASYHQSVSSIMPSRFYGRYMLLGSDVTPAEKVFSDCHSDRQFVYKPSKGKHQRPIAIGHKSSCLAVFSDEKRWLIPLSMRRVGSKQSENKVGLEQLRAVLKDPHLGLKNTPCIHLGDSTYSNVPYLYHSSQIPNLITISRLRGNRTLYTQPERVPGKKGTPRKYGAPFNLSKPETWPEPHAKLKWEIEPIKGNRQFIEAVEFREVIMRRKFKLPINKIPLRVIGFQIVDQAGKPKLDRRLWVVIAGKQRNELTIKQVFDLYRKRFDLEHFFRFSKQKMLFNQFQSPRVDHLENWWQIVCSAWTLLFAARNLAQAIPNPWERYLPTFKTDPQKEKNTQNTPSPASVQRDYFRIIQAFEPITSPPKRVKKAKGRQEGQKQTPRMRFQPIKKKKKKKKAA